MNDNLRRLNWIVKLFGVENFYQVESNKEGVTLFSHKDNEVLVTKLKQLKFKRTQKQYEQFTNLHKWVRGNYQVILH